MTAPNFCACETCRCTARVLDLGETCRLCQQGYHLVEDGVEDDDET